MRLPKAERAQRLLTRRRNELLAIVEAYVLGDHDGDGSADALTLARAMDRYVEVARPKEWRKPPAPPVDASRLLDPETARAIFGEAGWAAAQRPSK